MVEGEARHSDSSSGLGRICGVVRGITRENTLVVRGEIYILGLASLVRFHSKYSRVFRLFIQFSIFSSEKLQLRHQGRKGGREVAIALRIVLSLDGRSVTVTGQQCHCYHTHTKHQLHTDQFLVENENKPNFSTS